MNAQIIPYVALSVSIVAATLTLMNAAVGILNFVLSRCRLVRITEVTTSFERTFAMNSDDTVLSVDILSYGAAIHDMSVEFVIRYPFTEPFLARGFRGTQSYILSPVKPYQNPLTSGQGQRFELRISAVNPLGAHMIERAKPLKEVGRMIPNRNISLLLRCSGKRLVLKRERSARVRFALNEFLGRSLGYRPNLWRRTIGRLMFWFEMRRLIRENEFARQVSERNQKKAASTQDQTPPQNPLPEILNA